jgi:hypothetical protein
MFNCKSYTILILRFCFIILHSNSYSRICMNFFLFTKFDDTSSDEDFELAAVAKGAGKSTGDETDNEDKLYEEDDKDVQTIGKKPDEISGLCGVRSIVGGHVGQNHNPLRDNVSSNFCWIFQSFGLEL